MKYYTSKHYPGKLPKWPSSYYKTEDPKVLEQELYKELDKIEKKYWADKKANAYFAAEEKRLKALERRAKGEIAYKKFLARNSYKQKQFWKDHWAKKRRQRSMDRLLKDDPELYEMVLRG